MEKKKKEKGRREEEDKRRRIPGLQTICDAWNSCMKTFLGLCMDYMYGMVRNCLDSMYGIDWKCLSMIGLGQP